MRAERDIDVRIRPSTRDSGSGSRYLGRGTLAAIPHRMRLAIAVLVLLAAPAVAHADDPAWSGPPAGGPPGMTPYAPQPYAPQPYAPQPQPYAPQPYAPPPYAPPQPYAPQPYAQPQYVPVPAPLPPKATREVSYARQTLISDGIAAVLVTGAFLQDDPFSAIAMVVGGANVYMFGAPIVHWANGQAANGFKSLGVRIGLPWLGAMAGNLLGPKDKTVCDGTNCGNSNDSDLGAVIGAGLGALAAVVVDARYFAHKRVEVAPSFAPTANYSQSGFSVGLAGSF